MKTLAIVIVTVPLAASIGLLLGIWATRSPRIERGLNIVFDVLQATPHMAYLGPVVIMFGFGQVPAMLATLGFAVPPMARLTVLGIRNVPSDILESGRMSGCTPRQLLWKVELPAALPSIMAGLTQCIMLSLSMVVIATLIGAPSLGNPVNRALNNRNIPLGIEAGLAIVILAIILDRVLAARVGAKK